MRDPPAPEEDDAATTSSVEFVARLAERTPLRLLDEERVIFGVMEGALDHSEYTDRVDVSTNMHYVRQAWDNGEAVMRELEEACRTIAGLSVANDVGPRDLLDATLAENGEYFAQCFELGRRYKILNPDKMRSNYGKLLYMLMDAVVPSRQRAMGFSLVRPIQTVGALLHARGARALLRDAALVEATREIVETEPAAAQAAARRKLLAQQSLVDRFAVREDASAASAPSAAAASAAADPAPPRLTEPDVRRVLASVEDARSFLRSNRDPVERMLQYLLKYFDPAEPGPHELSLSLQNRKRKPRHELTHDHATQYWFVRQSLTLWRRIMAEFFALWIDAEEDLLDRQSGYTLANTGQGVQRCQHAPRTRANMNRILGEVQRECGRSWVGLSVVHLGDREVPNALVFIDKYTQVPRILAPVVRCLETIEGSLAHDPHAREYLDRVFGGPERCIQLILADLFRGGFDGGGDLGGSCIDGRLTSLWNWSSLIEKTPFYGVFLLSGFLGFDGSFR